MVVWEAVTKQNQERKKKMKRMKKSIFYSDVFDRRGLETAKTFYGLMEKTALPERAKKHAEILAENAFLLLYKYAPTLMKKEELEHNARVWRKPFSLALEADEVKTLRTATVGQINLAAYAAARIAQIVAELVPPPPPPAPNQGENNDDSNESDTAGDSGNGGDGGDSETNGDNGDNDANTDTDNTDKEDNGDENGGDENGDESQEQQNQNKAMLKALQKAVSDVNRELEEMESFCNAAGAENGTLQKLKIDELRQLAQLLKKSSELKALMDMIGGWKLSNNMNLRPAKIESLTGRMEIETGSDVTRLSAKELLYALAAPKLFLYRAAKAELELHKPSTIDGQEMAKAGPVILLIDESGSMTGPKIKWAKALAFAMLQQARKEKRDFAAICWSGPQDQEIFFFDRQIPLTKTVEQMESLVQHFYDGGTSLNPALEKARQLVEKNTNYTCADIVVITDGDVEDPKESSATLKNLRKLLKLKLILIELEHQGNQAIKEVVDAHYRVDTKMDSRETVQKVLKQIRKEK